MLAFVLPSWLLCLAFFVSGVSGQATADSTRVAGVGWGLFLIMLLAFLTFLSSNILGKMPQYGRYVFSACHDLPVRAPTDLDSVNTCRWWPLCDYEPSTPHRCRFCVLSPFTKGGRSGLVRCECITVTALLSAHAAPPASSSANCN